MKSDDQKKLHPCNAQRSAESLEATMLSAIQFREKHTSLYHLVVFLTGHQASQHLDHYIHAATNDSKEDEQL